MNKYRNKPTVRDGLQFDSRKESRRWPELQLLERAGAISDLRRQVPYVLIPVQKGKQGERTERSVKYIADFVYIQDGHLVVEDVKSKPTRKKPEYVIKRKLMRLVHGITIREV